MQQHTDTEDAQRHARGRVEGRVKIDSEGRGGNEDG